MSTAHITATHRERMAYVYVRQSTLWQVNEHQESTERQYRLQERALELGWPPTAITVIDEDQGRSGSSATIRTGFRRLVTEVSLGQVGVVLMLEASRLARNSSDWHQLIELCGLSHTLLADESTLYDPRDPNDRLLLGVKGTLSEAELFTLRTRLTRVVAGTRRAKVCSRSPCPLASSESEMVPGIWTPISRFENAWHISLRHSAG